jgi:glycosyltransferase involved in cell wall biosynthesis
MIKVLMFVNWPIYRVDEFSNAIRNPDQVIRGEAYWFSKYWPRYVTVDVVGVSPNFILYPLELASRIHLQFIKQFTKLKDYDLLLTYDSPSAFIFSTFRSKLNFCRSIPHVMVDIGTPRAAEDFYNLPPTFMQNILKHVFNSKSLSQIIFHSSCQRFFYKHVLGFSNDKLSFVPFGVETDYFKPEPVKVEDYIYAAGGFRDFTTLLKMYEKYHEALPELRIRTSMCRPKSIPPKVKWLPPASISTFKAEVLKSKFVIVPLHYTLRSAGLMTGLQSMSLGKAVLITKVPPIDGYVKSGETALTYAPYSPEDLFKKVTFLLSETDVVATMGKNARADIEKRFTVKCMGVQLWNSISKVLRSRQNDLYY